ncbi:MAG: hypothetical protein A2W29_05480 [Gemmatimonadetes bacterium RBG_16_66_8]|nr:MAG: hypothetical protein A2W29_05480 [Gemmatimonadetes bacterium RBG_16_66_8]
MRRFLPSVACLVLAAVPLAAQQPDSTPRRIRARIDSVPVQGGLYNRPFLASVGRTAVGGYLEGNTNYFREEGISDGFSTELRRFNIFLFSSIGSRIRIISELEFEHGTEEIKLETALLDFQVNPSFVLRGGILLPPVGAFNVNHDSPRWEVVERPLVSTEIIPATLSEVGFGAHGRLFPRAFTMTYDVYLTNGLGDGIVLNEHGRTRLASGKGHGLVGQDNNGRPSVSGRIGFRRRALGELGLSYYGGPYNTYRSGGVRIDERRDVHLTALDLTTELGPVGLRGEMAFAWIDVPADLREVFGERQWGFHLDAVVPLFRPRIRGLPDAVVNGVLRVERVDYNRGTFISTGDAIGDEVTALVTGVSFRPVAGTVLKANYRHERIRDLQGNATVRRAGFQFGLATYF